MLTRKDPLFLDQDRCMACQSTTQQDWRLHWNHRLTPQATITIHITTTATPSRPLRHHMWKERNVERTANENIDTKRRYTSKDCSFDRRCLEPKLMQMIFLFGHSQKKKRKHEHDHEHSHHDGGADSEHRKKKKRKKVRDDIEMA